MVGRGGAQHSELSQGFPYSSTLPPPGGLEHCMLAVKARLLGMHKRDSRGRLGAGPMWGTEGLLLFS